MSVTIRPGTPDDALAIATVHVASWQAAFRGILPDDALDAMTPGDRLPMWTRVLAPGSAFTVLVAEADGAVAGFASVGPSDEGVAGEMTLFTLYLHPGATGKGIGRALLAEAERVMAAQGAGAATLRVITANPRARHVYERAGWIAGPETARVEDAWGIPVETVRYRKDLGTQREMERRDDRDPRG